MKRPRGYPGMEIGASNLAQVRQWFTEHLGGTQQECANALELSIMAVNRHVKTLREEWRRAKTDED